MYSVRPVHFSRSKHNFSKCSGWKLHSASLKRCKKEKSLNSLQTLQAFWSKNLRHHYPSPQRKKDGTKILNALQGFQKRYWQHFNSPDTAHMSANGAAFCSTLSRHRDCRDTYGFLGEEWSVGKLWEKGMWDSESGSKETYHLLVQNITMPGARGCKWFCLPCP